MGFFKGPKKDYSKDNFSAADRFKYRADKMKKGSTYTVATGETKPYSDFARGKMCGVNQEQAKAAATAEFKRNNPNYVRKTK